MNAVIFDMDDTLYPTKAFVAQRNAQIASYLSQKYHQPEAGIFKALFHMWEKKTSLYPNLFDDFLAAYGLPVEEVPALVKILNSPEEPELKLPEETKEVLEKLKEKGLKLGLVTDGNVERQRAKAGALGLKNYFDALVFGNESGTKKTEGPFKKILKELGVEAKDAVMIGDCPVNDFGIAKKLGMKTVRIVKGEFENVPSGNDVDVEVKSLKEVMEVAV